MSEYIDVYDVGWKGDNIRVTDQYQLSFARHGDRVWEDIEAHISAQGSTCGEHITPHFVRKRFYADKPMFRYVAYGPDRKCVGFMIAEPKSDTELYMHIVCGTRGAGTMLLTDLLRYADKNDTDVTIHALLHTFTYYARHGFEMRRSCKSNVKKIPKWYRDRHLLEMFHTPQFVKFLRELTDEGYVAPRTKDTRSLPTCYSHEMPKNSQEYIHEYINRACEIDGYVMKRCKRGRR
jgi:hypothetical protein